MRAINKLKPLAIARLTAPGYYADGGNLVLQVSATGTKSWLFRYAFAGKRYEMGLGPFSLVSLADARSKAVQCRLQLLEGRNPLETRRAGLRAERERVAKAMSFEACARRCIADKRPEWKNAKHADQWASTLETYVYPVIGKLDVGVIDTGLVRQCLDPIWGTKTETASRVRQRVEAVLDWAKVHGYRNGDNPAAWRGHLEAVMPAPTKIAKAQNHASLPYTQAPAFIKRLRTRPGAAALALAFAIRTATRTGEVIGARREEFDREKRIWTIPASRMKAGIAHTVPLDAGLLKLVEAAQALDPRSVFVFPGAKEGRPLSNMAMLQLLRGMDLQDADGNPATVHGFRSTFRQWVAECTAHPGEVAEHALAHRLSDKTEAAYQRGSLLEKRRVMMRDWNDFLDGETRGRRQRNP